VQECERLVELEGHLARVLAGERAVADARERVAYASLCYRKRLFEQAARFYEAALAEDASLAEDLEGGHRYNAACAAALAGGGRRGGEAAGWWPAARGARRRDQARAWLRADLRQHAQALPGATPTARAAGARALQRWLSDPDLRGLRDDEALAKLPPAERAAC